MHGPSGVKGVLYSAQRENVFYDEITSQRENVFYDEITCHKRRKKSDIHEGSKVSVVSSSSWSNEYSDP